MALEKAPCLLSLPPELLQEIISYLPIFTLVDLSLTCRELYAHAVDDTLWQPVVNASLPSITPLTSPHPYSSFRALYAAFHPHWFLPKNKLWIADNAATGKLLLARYDSRRAVIEAHALVAERGNHTFSLWAHNPEVIIHTFSPRVRLDLNCPTVSLSSNAYATAHGYTLGEPPRCKLQREVPMATHTGPDSYGIFNTFMLTRPLDPSLINPGTSVWPPQIVPASQRTRNQSSQRFNGLDHKPECLSHMSMGTFRLRKWMQFISRSSPGGLPMRMGEDVVTYGTLSEEAYVPTANKPWRGLWVGDYSGHGCEFLLVTQPEIEEERPLPEGLLTPRNRSLLNPTYFQSILDTVADTESVTSESKTTFTEKVGPAYAESSQSEYGGRIEAIKLTGDPNVPRGEYTFIAPDIGPKGLIRVATEDPFKGARIVKAAGHIAFTGFREGELDMVYSTSLNEADANVTLHRSIHCISAYHDLTRSAGTVLGAIWAHLLLPAR